MAKRKASAEKTEKKPVTSRKTQTKKVEPSPPTPPLSFEEWAELAPVPCIILSDQPDGQNLHWQGFKGEGDDEVWEILKAKGWVDTIMWGKADISAQLASHAVTLWNKSKTPKK